MPRLLLLALLLGDEPVQKSDWKIECTVDELTENRRCALTNRTFTTAFVVAFVQLHGQKAAGPFVIPGEHDFPGKKATVRIDKNKAIEFEPGPGDTVKQAALVKQLQTGHVAKFEYYHWPDGAVRDSIEITGFAEAYKELLRERDQKGETSWSAFEASIGDGCCVTCSLAEMACGDSCADAGTRCHWSGGCACNLDGRPQDWLVPGSLDGGR